MSPKTRQNSMQVHFSSQTDLWSTPLDLFRRLDARFHFDVDVCAIASNAKCLRFFSPEQDGLKQEWMGTLFMNPPYGRAIGLWVRKAYESSLQGATVVCVLPARTDTQWFHKYVAVGADEVIFLSGRLKFGNATTSAPFPSVIVVFRPPAVCACAKRAASTPLFGDINACE